ncbi:MAG: YhcH/YjgK/YiaL family protein [Clostridia bacterium]|nr:YhcH/YjgK/YiaL family protein [Clostridia bacterium]
MWSGKVEELKNCKELSQSVAEKILAFIRENNMATLKNGRYPIDDGVFVNIFDYETAENDGVFETHARYADLHYPINGKEKLLWASGYDKETEPYREDGDYSFGVVENGKEVALDGTNLCYIAVGEAHKASVILDESVKGKKAVFKILVK